LNKPLYPSGFTKGKVIDYYRQIAPVMLNHLRDRAVTLKRYPNGSTQPFFFEKHCPTHRPDWVKTDDIASIRSSDVIDYCRIDEPAALVWIANLASLEVHVSLACAKKPDEPRMMVFDLDPGAPATILDCGRLALHMRDALAHIGIDSLIKTSGSKGLHLYIPLNTPVDFEQTKSFAHSLALMLERENPAGVTATMSKSLRGGKIFVDWSQNDQRKTTVCVYSLRARDEPTVSTPVSWNEIGAAIKADDPSRLSFTADEVLRRVARKGDLFEAMNKLKQRLPKLER
jgi:bifunctional non-homologous end joining protein LigD